DLGEARGERPLAEDLLRQLAGAKLQLSSRRDPPHKSDLERLLGVDDVPGQNHVLGPAHADETRQALSGTRSRNDPESKFRLFKLRRVRRESDVARQRALGL